MWFLLFFKIEREEVEWIPTAHPFPIPRTIETLTCGPSPSDILAAYSTPESVTASVPYQPTSTTPVGRRPNGAHVAHCSPDAAVAVTHTK